MASQLEPLPTVLPMGRSHRLPAPQDNKRRQLTSRSQVKATKTSAWLSNSVDPIDKNDKKGKYYWKDVADEFNNNCCTNGHKRTVKQLKTHWGNVKDIGKFCGVYAQVRRTCTSGHSDDMIMEKAHLWYKNQSNQKKPFTLEYMWRELKDQPKWRSIIKKEENKNKSTKISELGA
ncbi:hypothetical protein OsI_15046 [Oryza sativa Indica Group]|uniref:No apical meristem-associated C-terminal domain-containing protein n=1 Tax=Oryza sativa subsp. indica TaxID=39946 RepID=B8AR59_ORYSI|nr:hypothetical protein OsI_15046 [Oryza sativa Indica Group]